MSAFPNSAIESLKLFKDIIQMWKVTCGLNSQKNCSARGQVKTVILMILLNVPLQKPRPYCPPVQVKAVFQNTQQSVRYPIFIVSKLINGKWSLGEVFLFHLSELKHCLICLRAFAFFSVTCPCLCPFLCCFWFLINIRI